MVINLFKDIQKGIDKQNERTSVSGTSQKKKRICGSETSKISVHERTLSVVRAAKADQVDMIAIWDQIENEHGYQLSRNPQKHKCLDKCRKGIYVLSVRRTTTKKQSRRRGKSKRANMFQSDKLGIELSSFQEAQTVVDRMKFGSELHKHLQAKSKRFRGESMQTKKVVSL